MAYKEVFFSYHKYGVKSIAISCYIWYKTIRSYYWLKFWIYSESLFIDLHFSMSDMLDITELYFVSISLNKIQTANYFPYKYVLVWSKIVREV